jgi:hypothetical protein
MATRVLKFVPKAILVLLGANVRLGRHAVFPGSVREQDQWWPAVCTSGGADLTDLSSEASYWCAVRI